MNTLIVHESILVADRGGDGGRGDGDGGGIDGSVLR